MTLINTYIYPKAQVNIHPDSKTHMIWLFSYQVWKVTLASQINKVLDLEKQNHFLLHSFCKMNKPLLSLLLVVTKL